MLFDDVERTDDSPKRHTEGDFEFLNRSCRPEIQRVRDLLDVLLGEYAQEADRDELIARIRRGDGAEFRSAIFEIFLHGALVRLGYEVSCHPELDGSEGRPDFKVTSPDGSHFYLEASATSIRDGTDEGAEARKAVVYQAIERLENRSFFLDVSSAGDPSTPPSGRRLRGELEKLLDSLDPDALRLELQEHGHERMPCHTWKHDGWTLEFAAFPKAPDKRTEGSCVIGSYGDRNAHLVDMWTPIRDRVTAKGNRYGKLNVPFIVAINAGSFTLDKIDVMQALFGEETFIAKGDDGPEMQRELNGAFIGPNGPQYTRISAVWVFNDLNPYNVASRGQSVYVNPFAEVGCPESLLVLPHHCANETNQMRFHEGLCLRCIFDLEGAWLEVKE